MAKRRTRKNPEPFRFGEIVKAGNTLGVYIGEHARKAQSKIAISYKPMGDTIEVRYVPHVRIQPTTATAGSALREVLAWLDRNPDARGAKYATKDSYLKPGQDSYRTRVPMPMGSTVGLGGAGAGTTLLRRHAQHTSEDNLRQEDRYKENPRADFWSTDVRKYGDAEQVSSFATRSGNRGYVYAHGKSFVLQIYSPASQTIQQVTRYKTRAAAESAGLRRNSGRAALYEVLVGNIGTVHRGSNRKAADAVFALYRGQSKSGRGRAAGEDVTLFANGEPVREHQGDLRENPRRSATGNPGKVLREGEMLIHAGHSIQRSGSKFVVQPYGREFSQLSSAKAWLGRHVKREMTKPTRNPLALRTNGKGRPRGQVYRGLRVLSCGGVYIVEAYKEPFKTAAEARAWIDDQLGSAPVRRASKQIDVSANRPFPLSLFTANPRR
jgi:hypothetical protein